jgi:hypothetical protein
MTASFPCSEITGSLTLPFWIVENGVRDVSLREHNLPPLIFGYRFSLADLSEKYLSVKRDLTSLPHKGSPSAGQGWVKRGELYRVGCRKKMAPGHSRVPGCRKQSLLLRRRYDDRPKLFIGVAPEDVGITAAVAEMVDDFLRCPVART